MGHRHPRLRPALIRHRTRHTGLWLAIAAALFQLIATAACSAGYSISTSQPEASDLVADIRGAALRQHMSILASDVMQGRETGTPGFDRAAQYVADQFHLFGLTSVEGHFLQRMTIRRIRVDEDSASLTLRIGQQTRQLHYGEHYVSYGVRGRDDVSLEGPLVFAGDGVSVPGLNVDAYRNVDVLGKIVVLTSGAPSSLSESERSFYGDAAQKVATASARGASAVLMVDAPQIPWELRVRSARQLGVSDALPLAAGGQPIPLCDLRGQVAELLLGPAGNAPARTPGPIEGATVTLRLHQLSRDVRSANVVATLHGSDPRRSREHVVVLAHLNHVGIGEPREGDAIYNGAVDNASGISALLEIARTMSARPKRPVRTMVFLATTGEEQGLTGARHFVSQRQSWPGRVVAAINIDGTSIQQFDQLEIGGGLNSSLGAIAERAGQELRIGVRLEPLGVGGSDHSPFLLAGIPPLWIGAALPPDWMRTHYHTPRDDMQQPIDFAAAANYTRFVALVSWLTADAPTAPEWRTDEFFGRTRDE